MPPGGDSEARARALSVAKGLSRSQPASEQTLANTYRTANFFVVRSPLYPFRRLTEWSAQSPSPSNDPASWASRRAHLVNALRAQFLEQTLLEATFLASTELEPLAAASGSAADISPKLVRTLTRYFTRAASRETPFGLFAGLSLGHVGEQDRFELAARAEYRRRTSVAASYLHRILPELAADENLGRVLPYVPNPTLTRHGDQYRFANHAPGGTTTVMELPWTRVLERVAREAEHGKPQEELARQLEKRGLGYQDTLAYVLRLCELGFLVPSWLPPATGQSPLRAALEALSAYPAAAAASSALSRVEEALSQLDTLSLGTTLAAYGAVVEQLTRLSKPVPGPGPLQAELIKPAPRLTLSEHLSARFLSAASLIQRVNGAQRAPDLVEFCARFTARYESRSVPLAEALDSDLGLWFKAPALYTADAFVGDIPFGKQEPGIRRFDAFDRARLHILTRALSSGQSVFELDQEALDSFPVVQIDTRAESLAVIARVARSVDGRLLIVAPSVVGPSGISTLARFCHADAELAQAVRQHVAAEQALAGQDILADVAYFPNDNGANIVVRPVLRDFEIPYHGKSGAPKEQQISIEDLYITVEADRVVLHSAKHGRRVKIRIANAHHVEDETHLPMYRFFGALEADENVLAHRWSWGALDTAAFLPRIVHGDVILSLARFRLSEAELKPIIAANDEVAFELLQHLRGERRLPRWLTRAEGDQLLPVDLDNVLSVEELLHEARQRKWLVLQELCPDPTELVLQGPEGGFASEFVVPFLRREPSAPISPVEPQYGARALVTEHRHAPGSAWLYVKIYAPRSALNTILQLVQQGVLKPSLGKAAKLWFFLPFSDPEPHLRLRIRGNPAKLRDRVLPRLQRTLEPLLEAGTVRHWQLDTYEQEVERYGGSAGMSLAENVFWADSDATCQLLELCNEDHEFRWQLALLSIDHLLADASFDLKQRIAFADATSHAYAQELDDGAETRRVIGLKFRPQAARLTELLWTKKAHASGAHHRALCILSERSARNAAIWKEIRRERRASELHVSDTALARSFVHMHCIRLLGAEARAYERVLYDFLKRLYVARVAREEGTRVRPAPSR